MGVGDRGEDSLGMVQSLSSASCSVSLSSNLMSLNQDGSEWPSRELTLSLSGDGVSENSVLCGRADGEKGREGERIFLV